MKQECIKESKAITLSRKIGDKRYSYILHIGGRKQNGEYSDAVYIYKLVEKDVYNNNTKVICFMLIHFLFYLT